MRGDVWPFLLAALVVGAVWLLARPSAVFVVRLEAGAPRAARGTVTPGFLAAVADIAAQSGLRAGEIRGVARGRRIALWFSSAIPPGTRQRLRNWWNLSGWPAPARRA